MVGLISLLCLPTAGAVFLGREDSNPCHLQSKCVKIQNQHLCAPVTVGKAQRNLALYTYLDASAKTNLPLPTCAAPPALVAKCSASGDDVGVPCKTLNEELWWPEALIGFFSQGTDTITTSDKREYAGVERVVRLGRGARGIPSYGGIKSARDDLYLRIKKVGDVEPHWVPYVDSCNGRNGPTWKCDAQYVEALKQDNSESLNALQLHSSGAKYSHMFLDSDSKVHMWSDHMKVNGQCTRMKYVMTMRPNGRIGQEAGWQVEGKKEEKPCAWAQGHWKVPHYFK